jgi:hypothetical protein
MALRISESSQKASSETSRRPRTLLNICRFRSQTFPQFLPQRLRPPPIRHTFDSSQSLFQFQLRERPLHRNINRVQSLPFYHDQDILVLPNFSPPKPRPCPFVELRSTCFLQLGHGQRDPPPSRDGVVEEVLYGFACLGAALIRRKDVEVF